MMGTARSSSHEIAFEHGDDCSDTARGGGRIDLVALQERGKRDQRDGHGRCHERQGVERARNHALHGHVRHSHKSQPKAGGRSDNDADEDADDEVALDLTVNRSNRVHREPLVSHRGPAAPDAAMIR